ncbi:MAG: response regulator [Bacteroidota bacterium]
MKPTNKHTVLVVDDEPAILLSVSYLIEQAGFETRTATNGTEALEVAREVLPQIAVLDVMMPGMDGFKLAERLRTIEQLADLRIVFLTAKGTPQDLAEGYRSGGEVYLTKPFDNDDLVNTIQELAAFG